MTIIGKLRKIHEYRNILLLAIEELKTEEEIKQFYYEYIKWQRLHGIINSKDTVNKNIDSNIYHYGETKQLLWYSALKDIREKDDEEIISKKKSINYDYKNLFVR